MRVQGSHNANPRTTTPSRNYGQTHIRANYSMYTPQRGPQQNNIYSQQYITEQPPKISPTKNGAWYLDTSRNFFFNNKLAKSINIAAKDPFPLSNISQALQKMLLSLLFFQTLPIFNKAH